VSAAAVPAKAPVLARAAASAPATASAPAAAPAPSSFSAPESSQNGVDSEPEDDAASPDSLPEPSRAGASNPGSSAGDLRSIAGIGPRFEAALRKQGITRLEQIAAWSEDDVRQVAKALKIPKSRIVKGRWIESAREAIGTRAASE
jgi:predicted flap endonuclease-1-like 5' DNA nuclease